MVIGRMPKTLNETQVSVEKLRQTTSLSPARKKKNSAHLSVRMRQPSAVSSRTVPRSS